MIEENIELSLGRPSDLIDIHAMIRALCAFHGDTAQVDLATLQDMFFGAAPTATALIAKRNGVAIGYAGLTWVTVIHDAAMRYDVHHLYVVETERSKGVATALIMAARDHAVARGAVRLTIGTDPDNATAIKAYRAMTKLTEITTSGPRFIVDLAP